MTIYDYTPKDIERFWSKVVIAGEDDCWLWTASCKPAGYGQLSFGNSRVAYAHRVAYIITNGSIPDGLFVCHQCDNRRCVNPKHLFLGTNADNVRDMDRKGRRVNTPHYGENHPAVITSDAIVAEIRQRYEQGGVRQVDLAKEYGLRTDAVWRYVHYKVRR